MNNQVLLSATYNLHNKLYFKPYVFIIYLKVYYSLLYRIIFYALSDRTGFPGGSNKESACKVGGLCSIPGLGRSPGEGNGYPLQYSCQEKSHGQSSLAGYSPWGHKESDMTENVHAHW